MKHTVFQWRQEIWGKKIRTKYSTKSKPKKLTIYTLNLIVAQHLSLPSVLTSSCAITKYHRLGDLNNRSWFARKSGDWESEIRVPTKWVLVRALFLACLATFCCVLTWYPDLGAPTSMLKNKWVKRISTFQRLAEVIISGILPKPAKTVRVYL